MTRRVYQSLLASTPRNNFTLSLNKLRVLNHQNLARVMGACLEDDLKAIVVEHCTKGSLQVNSVKVSASSGEYKTNKNHHLAHVKKKTNEKRSTVFFSDVSTVFSGDDLKKQGRGISALGCHPYFGGDKMILWLGYTGRFKDKKKTISRGVRAFSWNK